MNRLQQLLAAAAAAVVAGGLMLGVALRQEGTTRGWTCAEWATRIAPYQDPQKHETFFVATQTGVTPPQAFGDRVIGACSNGVCSVLPEGCAAGVDWTYELSATYSGWRLWQVRAPAYIAGALRAWAEPTAGAEFLGPWSTAYQTCRSRFSATACNAVFEADKRCWLLADGSTCRYGLRGNMPNNSSSNNTACSPAADSKPMPCVVDRGAGSELDDVARAFADADYDELPE